MYIKNGSFAEWKKCSGTVCKKCKSGEVVYREWRFSEDTPEDYQYLCKCGYSWWADSM